MMSQNLAWGKDGGNKNTVWEIKNKRVEDKEKENGDKVEDPAGATLVRKWA